jgi:hypothetical protein
VFAGGKSLLTQFFLESIWFLGDCKQPHHPFIVFHCFFSLLPSKSW